MSRVFNFGAMCNPYNPYSVDTSKLYGSSNGLYLFYSGSIWNILSSFGSGAEVPQVITISATSASTFSFTCSAPTTLIMQNGVSVGTLATGTGTFTATSITFTTGLTTPIKVFNAFVASSTMSTLPGLTKGNTYNLALDSAVTLSYFTSPGGFSGPVWVVGGRNYSMGLNIIFLTVQFLYGIHSQIVWIQLGNLIFSMLV